MSKRIRKKKARNEIIRLVEDSRNFDGIVFANGNAIRFKSSVARIDPSTDENQFINIDCILKDTVQLKHFKPDENGWR